MAKAKKEVTPDEAMAKNEKSITLTLWINLLCWMYKKLHSNATGD